MKLLVFFWQQQEKKNYFLYKTLKKGQTDP